MLKAKKKKSTTEAKEAAIAEVTKEPLKRLNANIPESLYKQLQVKAIQEGHSVNELVIKWVNEYLSK